MGNAMEIIGMIWPLIVIQVVMQIFCIVKLLKEGSRNLNKVLWFIIILAFTIFGPILFLIFGARNGDNNDFS